MATSAKQTVALISGANTGIGLATAIQLAQGHRYHVVIGSRNAVAGQEAAASLVAKGLSVSSVQLDISSDESIATAVSSIDREFGALDVLINNAGVVLDYNGLSPLELFTQTLSTNVTGTDCLTEACLPLLRKSKLPRVVFVSSLMGSVSWFTGVLYISCILIPDPDRFDLVVGGRRRLFSSTRNTIQLHQDTVTYSRLPFEPTNVYIYSGNPLTICT
jgi:NAD(P)-dependent dehydrogenase (short-subunit alcohol dehydrogenase family)